MTELQLIDREKSGGQTEWIVGRGPYFISHKPDGDELWISRRPYGINEMVYKFNPQWAITLESIDDVIAGAPKTRCPACGAVLTLKEEVTHPKVCVVINEGPADLTEAELVAEAVARGKKEILEDVRSGRVPAHVETFGDLHDFVDANEYGGLCEDEFFRNDKPDMKKGAAVQEQLHQWIKSGDMANEAVTPCEHCKTPVFWDESALDYRHVNPTGGCPMALEPKPDESKRTILIHLNIEASSTDERSDDEIIDAVLAKVEDGLGGAPGSLATGSELEIANLAVCLALAEEI